GVAIARDAKPSDAVESTDSDMIAHDTIFTIWRPISKIRFLMYNVLDVRKRLGITRHKKLQRCLIRQYLSQVVSKNKTGECFTASLRVFVDKEQTEFQPTLPIQPPKQAFDTE
ncbi:hypothetical protein BGW38_004323, partial [Lunasporangiospora selenospora]